MARVVVVGGGFGGLAAAARLAKLGHAVTLVERSDSLGGALGSLTTDGFSWDTGPTHTLVPAVIRDLFRKSGRPAEREFDLQPLDPIREHRWGDSSLRLPGGSRAAQIAAADDMEPGRGGAWAAYVDSRADDWELLRRGFFEVPLDPGDRAVTRRLGTRRTLARRLRRALPDERLRDVAAHPFVAGGHHPRDVPEWMGVVSYLEQRFGAWTIPGGMGALADVLTARLATRRVTVLTRTAAEDVVVRSGRAVAVRTAAGEIEADHVVCAIDPRRLPALAPHVAHTVPAMPPVVVHLGLAGADEALPAELVLHGDPLLVVRTGGRAPAGHRAWTVHGRGRICEDLVVALARHRLEVRDQVVVRIDRSPRDLVEQWGGSPMGVLWQGRGTVRRRLGPTTPIPGVYAAGAHATPGAGLPFTGLSAALVAQAIGSDSAAPAGSDERPRDGE